MGGPLGDTYPSPKLLREKTAAYTRPLRGRPGMGREGERWGGEEDQASLSEGKDTGQVYS